MKSESKGITLVALVITIILLLILAGISIQAITNTGLFENAKQAKNATENATKNEEKILNDYERYIDNYMTAQETGDSQVVVQTLWENSDKEYNSFEEGQTINLANDNYDYFDVIFKYYNTEPDYYVQRVYKGYTFSLISGSGYSNKVARRKFEYVNDTTFKAGASYWGSTSKNNKTCIPVKIIGYKYERYIDNYMTAQETGDSQVVVQTLWENSDKEYNSFEEGQTINLANDNYDYFDVIFKYYNTEPDYYVQRVYKGYTFSLISGSGYSNKVARRKFEYVNDTTFKAGASYWGSTSKNNKTCIPVKIIGYKYESYIDNYMTVQETGDSQVVGQTLWENPDKEYKSFEEGQIINLANDNYDYFDVIFKFYNTEPDYEVQRVYKGYTFALISGSGYSNKVVKRNFEYVNYTAFKAKASYWGSTNKVNFTCIPVKIIGYKY